MSLLIAEAPLVVLPSLAEAVGLNEALVLQQVHFWSSQSPLAYDGLKWMYRTDSAWIKEFRFWSESTLRRAVTNLKKRGLIRVEKLAVQFGGNSFDRKKYYAVNYDAVNSLELKVNSSASGQFEQMEEGGQSIPHGYASSQNDQIDTPSPLDPSKSASGQNDYIELSNVTDASSQNDQFRSSQNDQFRSSQNDQMLKENNKRDIREEENASAVNNSSLDDPHPVFNTVSDLPTAAALANQSRFTMHFEWMPGRDFSERCRLRGVLLHELSTDEQESLLAEFRSYWNGEQTPNTQSGWEHRLSSRIQRVILEKQSGRAASGVAAGKQSARAAVTESIMNVGNTEW